MAKGFNAGVIMLLEKEADLEVLRTHPSHDRYAGAEASFRKAANCVRVSKLASQYTTEKLVIDLEA